MEATHGSVVGMTNEEADKASRLFEEKEGVDIMPAAAVAVAALIKAEAEGQVGTDERILLNITGGGERLLRKTYSLDRLSTDISVERNEQGEGMLMDQIKEKLLEVRMA